MSLLSRIRRLATSTSGVAMTEFALGAPFLLTAGLWGAEQANYALTTMKVSQIAILLADNASRIGDTSTLQNRKIYESDINDVIYGAQIQGGNQLNLYDRGRVFISSVQEGAGANQTIAWQRCRGAKNVTSSYGAEGKNLGKNGIGPTGEEVAAEPGDAVIFVEVNYTYRPLVSAAIVGNLDIKAIASFTVRDKRDITQIYQRNPAKPDPVQTCNTYKGNVSLSASGGFN